MFDLCPFCLFIKHYVKDLSVGFLHTVAGEAADRVDGVFDSLFDDAVAAEELIAGAEEVEAEKTVFDCGCDFCGTACLCSVTNKP